MINTNHFKIESIATEIDVATSPFHHYLENLHNHYKNNNEGELYDCIPELKLVEPQLFGISIMTADGKEFNIGDWYKDLTIQSIPKVFVYGLALEIHGRDAVHEKVNVEPRGEVFNSIVLDEKTNRPHNPMLNSGAIAVTDLIESKHSTGRL